MDPSTEIQVPVEGFLFCLDIWVNTNKEDQHENCTSRYCSYK